MLNGGNVGNSGKHGFETSGKSSHEMRFDESHDDPFIGLRIVFIHQYGITPFSFANLL